MDVIKEISLNLMDWEIMKELLLFDVEEDILYR